MSYWRLITKSWLVRYILLRIFAIAGMLYVYYSMYIGRASVCSAGISLLITSILGSLYLKEKISKKSLFALTLIIIALVLQGWH